MRAPAYWQSSGLLPLLLTPAASMYGAVVSWRQKRAAPWQAPVPIICIGNLVAGGAGKTPVVIALANRLIGAGWNVHLLSRGYGGRESGPIAVDPSLHDAFAVGDEPLLLARAAPTWVARDRAAGARSAVGGGAQVVLLDDGFQNHSLAKDFSIVVADGSYGFGNGRLLPAGPLREPADEGLARADALILFGSDRTNLRARLPATLPVIEARLMPSADSRQLAGEAVVAFAGIGRPDKFFKTLESLPCDVLGRHSFADHHRYRDNEILVLADKADKLGARLVTTAKDAVRLPEHLRALVTVVGVDVCWNEQCRIDELITAALRSR